MSDDTTTDCSETCPVVWLCRELAAELQTDLAAAKEQVDVLAKRALYFETRYNEQTVRRNAELQRIAELEELVSTVQINCNPPDDCNDPKVLKTYMKACFDLAMKLQK